MMDLAEWFRNLFQHESKFSTMAYAVGEDVVELEIANDYYKDPTTLVRKPLTRGEAFKIAAESRCIPATPLIVDLIYAAAGIKLTPIPMKPGPAMTTKTYYEEHNRLINKQLEHKTTHRVVIAGHKKDIVFSKRYEGLGKDSVAIYGWQKPGGGNIQPLSTVHGKDYWDYSHGLRLVKQEVSFNGKPINILKLLSSDRWHLVSNEGPFRDARTLFESLSN